MITRFQIERPVPVSFAAGIAFEIKHPRSLGWSHIYSPSIVLALIGHHDPRVAVGRLAVNSPIDVFHSGANYTLTPDFTMPRKMRATSHS